MSSTPHFWITLAACLLFSNIEWSSSMSINEDSTSQRHREKRESGCCRENEGVQGGKNDGGCCQDEDKGAHEGACCQDEGNKDQDGDCCQINNNNHAGHAQGGCSQETAMNDPSRYNRGNVQPNGYSQKQGFNNAPLHEANPKVPHVPLHKEDMMKALLGEPFLENVRKGDENTLLLYSTMLAKLQSYMENLKFQMDEVRNDLHLKFQGFDNWASHTDRVIDSAIALVRRRIYEVQWGDKKHSDLKSQRVAG